MSHRGSDCFPEEIAVSALSAVDGAVVCSQACSDDDHRLLKLIDAWPTLSEATRDVIAKLVGDNANDLTVAPAGKAETR